MIAFAGLIWAIVALATVVHVAITIIYRGFSPWTNFARCSCKECLKEDGISDE